MKEPKIHEPEKLLILRKCRVKQHGETGNSKHVEAGQVVTVSGIDKQSLLANGLATRDISVASKKKAE